MIITMKQIFPYFRAPIMLFTFILTLKYYGLQLLVFQNPNPLDCLLVAVPSLLFFTIPVELLFHDERKKKSTYFILNALLSAAMVSVIVYYKQFGIIVTYHAFMQAHQVIDVSDSILDLLKPLYVVYFLDFLLLLGLKLFKKFHFSTVSFHRKTLASLWGASLTAMVILGFSYGNLLNELKQAERMGLVAYQAHTVLEGLRSVRAEAATIPPITAETVRSVKNISLPEHPSGFGLAEGRNLIIIQLESFQNFLIGMKVGGQEITPNLNRLLEESYYFSNIYQSIGQGNTSDAEFIVNTGFYPPAKQAASQAYGTKVLPSLPRLLEKQGYRAITLHTNAVEFWNREQLYPALGFDRYYDKTYFGEEDIIAFGPSDEVLYDKSMPILKSLHNRGVPFYAQLIAQSSHHPFLPPETKPMIPLPEEWENTDIGNYLKMTNYSDRALGHFIARLKEEGLWEQSMIVIYGDHFGVSPYSLTPAEQELIEGVLERPYDARTVHNIPLFITIPGVSDRGAEYRQLGGQIDFMTTIGNLLGLDLSDHIQFGQDLLNTEENILGSRFYLPTGSFFNDEIMYISGETFGEGEVIPITPADSLQEADPNPYKDDFVRIMRLLEMNDAYLKALPDRH